MIYLLYILYTFIILFTILNSIIFMYMFKIIIEFIEL